MYSIYVNGYIPAQKEKEFKQHMKQLIGQQNSDLINLTVMQDISNEDLYQVKIEFMDKDSVFSFMNSDNYKMISGSLKTLGLLREKHIIEYSDLEG